MRTILALGLIWAATLSAAEVQIGETYDAVIAQKGAPAGSVGGGDRLILRYPDQIIKLRARVVVGQELPPVPPPELPPAIPTTDTPVGESQLPFPRSFVGSPEFHTSAGVQTAGTAFLARRAGDSQIYLLTVRHLLGPDGGFATEVAAEQVPAFVQRIRMQPLWGGSRLYTVKGLKVPATADGKAAVADLAIFKAGSAAAADTAPLAEQRPAVGEPVWVIGHVRGGVAPGTLIHRTTVSAFRNDWLVCEFANSEIVTNGASGAPVINAQGQVVGIYSGHSKQAGKQFAFVIPSETVLRILRDE